MKAKSRFQQARLFVAGGTIAVLLGTWSALTVHDIQAQNADAAASTNTTNVVTTAESVPVTTSAPSTSSTTSRQTTTTVVPHTRTKSS
jgi:uncharacterized membrane protein